MMIHLMLFLFLMVALLAIPTANAQEDFDRACLTMPTTVCDGGAD